MNRVRGLSGNRGSELDIVSAGVIGGFTVRITRNEEEEDVKELRAPSKLGRRDRMYDIRDAISCIVKRNEVYLKGAIQ
jgi:hypothetical protein